LAIHFEALMFIFKSTLFSGAFLLCSPYKGITEEKEPVHHRKQSDSAYSLTVFNLA